MRHHPVEYLSAMAVFWIAIVSIGIPGPVLAFQGVCAFVGAAAVHGAVRWPPWLERCAQPVIVTRNGRDRTVMISVEEYKRLKRRDRIVRAAWEFSAEELEAIRRAEPPAEAAAFDHEFTPAP